MNRLIVYAITILAGLYVSANYGEWPVNIWCIGLFLILYYRAERRERIEMITVIALATPMELFFSEVWLIYEYQRDLMPLFVPVGHWFLFDSGKRIAEYINPSIAMYILVPFIPLVIYGVYVGTDTSGVILLVLVLLFTKFGPQPSLYVTMAWLALLMELWGTYLENWTWADEVPWTGLTAWNPPLLVGAFYCLGDLLVNLSVDKFENSNRIEVNI